MGANDGSVLGPIWNTGRVGPALEFDGSGDYVLVPNSPSLQPDRISLALWVKPDQLTPSDARFLYRLTYTQLSDARWLSHREVMRVFYRLLTRAQLHVVARTNLPGGASESPRTSSVGSSLNPGGNTVSSNFAPWASDSSPQLISASPRPRLMPPRPGLPSPSRCEAPPAQLEQRPLPLH